MRRVSLLLCIVLALLAVPGMASAQSWHGSCGIGNLECGLDLYLGYATNAGVTKGQGGFSGPGFGGLNDFTFDFDPTHALYLGAALPVNSPLGMFRLSGSLTAPATSRSVYIGQGAVPSAREWSTNVMWTTLEALYGLPVGRSTHLLAGFRWDRFDTSSRNPRDPSGLFVFITADTDRASWTVNGYIPLLGLMTSTNGFTLGLLGFPSFYGDQVYNDAFNGFDQISASGRGTFNKGYYFELFTDLTLNNANLIPENVGADFTLFAKFIFMAGRGNTNIIFNDTGSGTNLPATLDSTYYRRMVVLGGKVNFSTGLLDGLTGHVGL